MSPSSFEIDASFTPPKVLIEPNSADSNGMEKRKSANVKLTTRSKPFGSHRAYGWELNAGWKPRILPPVANRAMPCILVTINASSWSSSGYGSPEVC